jgi:hypothetical protein
MEKFDEKKRFYGLTGLKSDIFSVFILGKTAQAYSRGCQKRNHVLA